jgi:hypothetical protein
MQPLPPRPFGLVLLTALNLGFGLYNLGAAVQLGLALALKLDPSRPPGFDPGIAVGLMALPLWFVVYAMIASVIKAVLLFVSGIGYFNFKRVLGRGVGNAYAIVSLVDSAVVVVGLPYGISGGTVIGILYPVFTLLALNTMFKPLLTR